MRHPAVNEVSSTVELSEKPPKAADEIAARVSAEETAALPIVPTAPPAIPAIVKLSAGKVFPVAKNAAIPARAPLTAPPVTLPYSAEAASSSAETVHPIERIPNLMP